MKTYSANDAKTRFGEFIDDAQRLVSGDDDWLCLHPLNDLSILTPRAALEEIDRARRCHKLRCLRQ